MRDDIFDLHVGVLLGRIMIEQGFQLVDEIVILPREFNCAHDYVVGSVLPCLVGGIVDTISAAGEVQALGHLFGVRVEDVAPLQGSYGPFHEILIHVVVEALSEISPSIIVF